MQGISAQSMGICLEFSKKNAFTTGIKNFMLPMLIVSRITKASDMRLLEKLLKQSTPGMESILRSGELQFHLDVSENKMGTEEF